MFPGVAEQVSEEVSILLSQEVSIPMIKRERRLNGAWSRAPRSRFTDFCFYFLGKNAVNHTAHGLFCVLVLVRE